MNITLHGAAGLAAAICALWGAASILTSIQVWVSDRFTLSAWRVHRRWDRSGAWVILPDGREAVIEEVYREAVIWAWGAGAERERASVAPAMAVVSPYVDEEQQGREWVLAALLAPRPKCLEVTDA